jgi:hypothetical protein
MTREIYKINKNEIKSDAYSLFVNKNEIKSDAYSLFVLAINSPVTKERYILRLDRFFRLTAVEATDFKERL